MNKLEYDTKLVKKFNDFYKIKNIDKVTKTAQKRYLFFQEQIINNRILTVKSYQFCTTKLAEKYGVHHSTVSKWLKSLVRLGILQNTCSKWMKGKFSKSYRLHIEARDEINEFNGYAQKFKKSWHKYKDRSKKLKEFDIFLYEFPQAVKLASGWLGCPKQFAEAIKKKIPQEVLEAPREHNIRQQKIHDFLKAYNYVAKTHKYPRIQAKTWYKFFDGYNLYGGLGSYDLGADMGSEEVKDQILGYQRFLDQYKYQLLFTNKKRFNYMVEGMAKAYKFFRDGNKFSLNFVPMAAIMERGYAR
jgi:predicted transcriptional regulator